MNWNPSLRNLLAVCALCVLVAVTYHNSFQSRFVLDNKYIISEDPRLQAVSWPNIKLIFTEDYWYPRGVGAIYRPITTLSFLLDYSILGHAQNPAGYHWINLLLHLLNVTLVYFVTLKLLDRPWPALAAAALFAAHPIAVESVTNLVGRSDLFATAAVLGGMLIYMHAVKQYGGWRWAWLSLLLLVTAIGLLCKESAIVVVAILPVYDLAFRFRRSRSTWPAEAWASFEEFFLKGYVVLLPPLIGLFTIRHFMYLAHGPSPMAFEDNLLRGADFIAARLTAIKVIGYYIWLLCCPVHLSCDYSYNQVPLFAWRLTTFEDWKTPLSIVLVVVLLGAAVWSGRRRPALSFFILFFFIALLPMSNLIVLIDSNMAERFLYLPMVGFVGCVAVLADYAIPQRSRRMVLHVGNFALAVLIVLLVVRTVVRNGDWQSNLTLYGHDAAVVPQSARIHRQMSYALYASYGSARLDDAIKEAEQAARILHDLPAEDDDAIVYIYLGNDYGEKGESVSRKGGVHAEEDAKEWYLKSVRALKRAQAIDEAVSLLSYQRARARGKRPLEIPPLGQYQIYQNLGASYSHLGMHSEAERAYRKMVRLKPEDAQEGIRLEGYIRLAKEELQLGRADEAAILLLESYLVGGGTGRELSALAGLYGTGTAGVPAPTDVSAGHVTLNLESPIVAAHVSSACERLVESMLESQQPDAARDVRAFAVNAHQNLSEIDAAFRRYGLDPFRPTPK